MGKELKEAADKITDKQKNLIDNMILLNMSYYDAVKEAGYGLGSSDNGKSNAHRIYREVFHSENGSRYVQALRSELERELLVDKYYIIKKFKKLAEDSLSENVQIKALENLGKIDGLYVEKIETSTNEDAAQIARNAFNKRQQEEEGGENVIRFSREANAAVESPDTDTYEDEVAEEE